MSIDNLVNVSITATQAGITRAGFGTALVAAYHQRSLDRVLTFTSSAAMLTAGFTPDDPAYRKVAAAFAQNPRPARVKVGRRANPPTMVFTLTPSLPAAGQAYTLEVGGHTVTYTADGSPTVAEWTAGVTAALNALTDPDAVVASALSAIAPQTLTGAALDGVLGGTTFTPTRQVSLTFSAEADWLAGTATVTGTDANGAELVETFSVPAGGDTTLLGTKRFARVTSIALPAGDGIAGTFTAGVRGPVTAVDGATLVTCTAPPGLLHTVTVPDGVSYADISADPGLAADLAAIFVADPDWYGLLLDTQNVADIEAAATWTEANRKLFAAQSADTAITTSATTDIASRLKASAWARTTLWYHPRVGQELAVAIMGQRLTSDPGSDTWAYKTVAGVAAYALNATAQGHLEGKWANWYQAVQGVNITFPGKVSANEWVDIVRGVDWLRAQIQEGAFGLLVGSPKIPYTDDGIDRVTGMVRAKLLGGIRVGLLAEDPTFTVSAPAVADVPSITRAARHLPGVTFAAPLAGAIHTLTFTGVVSA